MNMLLAISSITVLVIFILSQSVKYYRFKHVSKMRSAYDKIEMYFIDNRVHLNRDHINFLKALKYFYVNPSALDVELLILSKVASDKDGTLNRDDKKFTRTLKSMPNDFKPLFDSFDSEANIVLKYSLLKPSFIWFSIKILFFGLFINGIKSFRNISSDIKYAFAKNEVLAMRLSLN